MEVTKEMIAELKDDDISKKRYDAILSAISNQADTIWRYIIFATPKRKLDWWAFSNDLDLGNGNGSTGGNFDPETDSEFIEITGEFSSWKNDFYEWNDGFPTELLWDKDYKITVNRYVFTCGEKQEAADKKKGTNKDIKKEKRQKLIDSAKSKLTLEELSMITFKKA